MRSRAGRACIRISKYSCSATRQGTAEVAAELGIRHFPDVDVNEYGTPLMSGYFQQAEEVARHSRMCYVNADIVLFPDLLEAVAKVDLPKFVMGGRRTDYDIEKPVDFTRADWAEALREDAQKNGTLHGFSAIDYFVYPRGMFGEIPQFALGRWYWDNWLVYRARRLGGALIDASACVMAIHQNHDYRHIVHVDAKGESRNQGGIESFGNRLLVESITMTLEDADWQVDRLRPVPHLPQDALAPLERGRAPGGDSRTSRVDPQAARVDRAPAVGPELEATLCGAALGAARIDRSGRELRGLRRRRHDSECFGDRIGQVGGQHARGHGFSRLLCHRRGHHGGLPSVRSTRVARRCRRPAWRK